MAVYKASNCSPHLMSKDIRIGENIVSNVNFIYDKVQPLILSCKISTSNKNVTGYHIILKDNTGKEIFNPMYDRKASPESSQDAKVYNMPVVSPVSELKTWYNNLSIDQRIKYGLPEYDTDINTGINGTYLYIPLVQNENSDSILYSLNNIYCQVENNNYSYYYQKVINDSNYELLEDNVDLQSNNTYTWEIVLFQDRGFERSVDDYKHIYYDFTDETLYDMVINEGTYLGSTGKRIQICNPNYTFNNEGEAIPTADVLLQTRWIQLGTAESEGGVLTNFEPALARGYVQTYDSIYGHVYPKLNTFPDNIFQDNSLGDIQYCQFYKIGNNEDAILATETVECASTTNVPITCLYKTQTGNLPSGFTNGLCYFAGEYQSGYVYYNGTWPTGTSIDESMEVRHEPEEDLDFVYTYSCSMPSGNNAITDIATEITAGEGYTIQNKTVLINGNILNIAFHFVRVEDRSESCTLRVVVTLMPISDSWIDVCSADFGGRVLEVNDTVLIKEQTDAVENGVFTYQGDIKRGSNSDNTELKLFARSGSYTTWSKFINAVIFVRSEMQNYQSQATGGGTLFNWREAYPRADCNRLYFNIEKPIDLFTADIKDTVTYLADSNPTILSEVDGYIPQLNETCLWKNKKYIYQSTGFEEDTLTTINQGDVYKILKGKVNGNRTVILNITGTSTELSGTVSGSFTLRANSQISFSGNLINSASDIYINNTAELTVTPTTGVVAPIDFIVNGLGQYSFTLKSKLGSSLGNWEIKFKYIQNATPDFVWVDNLATYTAQILLNTDTTTFITPFLGLDKMMQFKDQNNQWLLPDSIDKNVWRITHEAKSYTPYNPLDEVKYQLMAFFKKSDENLFITNKSNALNLTINGIDPYAESSIHECPTKIFYDPNTFEEKELSVIDKTPTIGISPINCKLKGEVVNIISREIKLSWKNYKWQIANSDGEIVLDLDTDYEGEIIDHISYLDQDQTWYGILTVEDYNGIISEVAIKFSTTSMTEDPSILAAMSVNCKKNAVEINIPVIAAGYKYDIFRREYEVGEDRLLGRWELVSSIDDERASIIYDYNVKNHHTYKYMVVKYDNNNYYYNYVVTSEGTAQDYINIIYKYWSIVELIPQNTLHAYDDIKGKYSININNQWFFKYNFNDASFTQNISKNSIENLSALPRVSMGHKNYITGQVSCYLGSEICYDVGYLERSPQARNGNILSSNERAEMLRQWRKFVMSPYPKLLRDVKGQSWIVDITSSSNTDSNVINIHPTQISFDWVEIEKTDNIQIYDRFIYPKKLIIGNVLSDNYFNRDWSKVFIKFNEPPMDDDDYDCYGYGHGEKTEWINVTSGETYTDINKIYLWKEVPSDGPSSDNTHCGFRINNSAYYYLAVNDSYSTAYEYVISGGYIEYIIDISVDINI